MAGEATMVIKKQAADDSPACDCVVQDGKEAVFGFAEAGFDIRNDPAPVIEQTEDDRCLGSPCGGIDEKRTVRGDGAPEFRPDGGSLSMMSRDIHLHR